MEATASISTRFSTGRLKYSSRNDIETYEINCDFQRTEYPGYNFENTESDFGVMFKSDIAEPEFMRFYHKDAETLVSHIGLGWYDPNTDKLEIFKTPETTQARISNNTIYFNNAYKGMSLKYVVNEYGVKDFLKIENPHTISPVDSEMPLDSYLVIVNQIEHSEAFAYSGTEFEREVYFLNSDLDETYRSPKELIAYDANFNKIQVSKWIKIIENNPVIIHGVKYSEILKSKRFPFTIDATFTVDSSNIFNCSSNLSTPIGICNDETYIYAVNSVAGTVTRYNKANGSQASFSTPITGLTSPVAITQDSTYLYVVNGGGLGVNRYIKSSGVLSQPTPTFSSVLINTYGIAISGNYLYRVEQTFKSVRRFNKYTLIEDTTGFSCTLPNTPYQIVIRGAYIFVSTTQPSMYKINLSSGSTASVASSISYSSNCFGISDDSIDTWHIIGSNLYKNTINITPLGGLTGGEISVFGTSIFIITYLTFTGANYVLQRRTTTSPTTAQTFNIDLGNRNKRCITSDANYVYVGDNVANNVKRYSASTGAEDTSFVCNSGISSPVGLALGDYLYVSNSTGVITIYDLTTGARVLTTNYPISYLTSGLAGITNDTDYLYLTNTTANAITRYNKTDGLLNSTGFTCNTNLASPKGLTQDSSYLYANNATTISKFAKSSGTFSSSISTGASNNNYIENNTNYLYVTDVVSKAIQRYSKATGLLDTTNFSTPSIARQGITVDADYIYTVEGNTIPRYRLNSGALAVTDTNKNIDCLVTRADPYSAPWQWTPITSTLGVAGGSIVVDQGSNDTTDPKNPVWVPNYVTYNGMTSFPYFYFNVTLPSSDITSASLTLNIPSTANDITDLGGLVPCVSIVPYKPYIDTAGVFTRIEGSSISSVTTNQVKTFDLTNAVKSYVTNQLANNVSNFQIGVMLLPVDQSTNLGSFYTNYYEQGQAPVLTINTSVDVVASTGSLFFAKG